MAKSYRQLVVWQKAIQLTVQVYLLTKAFPREEIYGLTSQMRRCAEYTHFLGIARGSHFELQTQLTIARELGLGDAELISAAENLSEEVGRMIFATIRSLQESQT